MNTDPKKPFESRPPGQVERASTDPDKNKGPDAPTGSRKDEKAFGTYRRYLEEGSPKGPAKEKLLKEESSLKSPKGAK